MSSVPEIFGSMVFNDKVMKERLPEEIYSALQNTLKNGKRIDKKIIDAVAAAMKDWAVEKGATHFTHWFQPMTGFTAEKHDSFICPDNEGSVIMDFSGKDLIKGEPDASSFPSGGLRATFEARGYTAWDPTSYAFIKDRTLCIPSAFVSYGGEALDKKSPLLRSMEVINKHALRILRLFGNHDATRVYTTTGAEQEYFLIDRDLYNQRKDLIFCGRTLFGAKAPKDQQKEDHYFGRIKPRIAEFMRELDEELWKLGVFAKTEHNEVAPAQHELAPVYTATNIAADHNQLTMEFLKRVAKRHNMACILHEKPFAGINGSGKHNNWSLTTDLGENLLYPGDTPEKNAQFLLFLVAFIKAADKYQDLLRLSVASAGNDLRLGGGEAPPTVISIFLGDELTNILKSIENNTLYDRRETGEFEFKTKVLPTFFKDITDRNRTSPLAFTGNKFELRMLGSSLSISDANVVLNTIMAEALDELATRLEASDNFERDLTQIIKETMKEHGRIIFNGNNYSGEWAEEAKRRGLLNYKTAVDVIPCFLEEKNIRLFTKYKIFTEHEIRSRYKIMLEEYSKTKSIEALTMCEMTRRDILPAVMKYIGKLSENAKNKSLVLEDADNEVEKHLIKKLTGLAKTLLESADELEKAENHASLLDEPYIKAKEFKEKVMPVMDRLRGAADEAEKFVPRKIWPFPTYGDLLFSV